MITWNYRVFRETNADYAIREVFYDEAGSILGCTAQSVEPFAASLDDLATTLQDFQAALVLPLLTVAEMPQVQASPRKRPAKTYSSADIRARLGLPVAEQSSKSTAQQ